MVPKLKGYLDLGGKEGGGSFYGLFTLGNDWASRIILFGMDIYPMG